MGHATDNRLLHAGAATEAKVVKTAGKQKLGLRVNALLERLFNNGVDPPREGGHGGGVLKRRIQSREQAQNKIENKIKS